MSATITRYTVDAFGRKAPNRNISKQRGGYDPSTDPDSKFYQDPEIDPAELEEQRLEAERAEREAISQQTLEQGILSLAHQIDNTLQIGDTHTARLLAGKAMEAYKSIAPATEQALATAKGTIAMTQPVKIQEQVTNAVRNNLAAEIAKKQSVPYAKSIALADALLDRVSLVIANAEQAYMSKISDRHLSLDPMATLTDDIADKTAIERISMGLHKRKASMMTPESVASAMARRRQEMGE